MPFFSFSFSKSSPNIHYDDGPWLPGAWASVWSLSHQPLPDQFTNGQPNLSHEDHHTSLELDLQESSSINVQLQPLQSSRPDARHSLDLGDDSSLLSAEYHSFDSHQESENHASLTAKQSDDDILDLKGLNVTFPKSSNNDLSEDDTRLSTDPSSQSSIQTPDLTLGDSKDMLYRLTRPSSCLLGIPEHTATTPYASSRENSIHSNYPRSLTDSATDGYDTSSIATEPSSNAIGGNDDQRSTPTIALYEPHQHTFLDQLSETSSIALGTVSVASPPNSFHILDFSQPDGDNSWTLALDPVAGAHELTSQQSSSSLATTASSVSTESTHDAPSIPTTVPFPPSSPCSVDASSQSAGVKPTSKRLFLRERVASNPYRIQGSSFSVRDNSLSTPTRPSFGDSIVETPTGGYAYGGPSRENIPRPEPPYSPYHLHSHSEDRSKNVLKKTVTKLKRLFNTKAKFRDADNHPRSSASPVGLHPALASPISATFPSSDNSLHRTISPSSAVYRSVGLPRSVKLSTPSVAFSSMHDSNSTRTRTTSNINLEEKTTYEYHARPKTLDEIRSKRRFSLPSVLVGSGSRPTPFSSGYSLGSNNSTSRIAVRPITMKRNTGNPPPH